MKKVFSLLISNLVLALTFANKAFAQEEFGINDLADAGVVLGTRSIQDTIGGIINIFLGFLGILATLLLLYAGFLWMTSRGNAEKVEKAKLLIASAAIGLVIIVSAYAISRFILSKLYEVTEPGGVAPIACVLDTECASGCCDTAGSGTCQPYSFCNPTITCSEPLDDDEPRVCSLSRSSGPVGSNLTIRGWHFDTDDDNLPGVGRVEIDGEVAEIVECGTSQMWDDRRVRVKIPDSLDPGNYEVILYNDVLPTGVESVEFPHFDFTVTAGISPVNVDCLVPDEGPAGIVTDVTILGDGFTDIEGSLSMNGWFDDAEVTLINENLSINSWTDLEINMSVPINALASDIVVEVGGYSGSGYFDVTCEDETDCDSGCCDNNSCMPADACSGTVIPSDNQPFIDGISPEDGEGGTLLTIFGYNFGTSVGVVTIGGEIALTPPICGDVWTDTYIVIQTPGDVTSLNELLDVVVTQSAAAGAESSDASFTWFERNDTVRPGICSLIPDYGSYGDAISIQGVNFSDGDIAYFDDLFSYVNTYVDDNNFDTEVPNVVGVNLPVTIQTNDPTPIASNAFPFSALSVSGGNPVIIELSPNNGPMDSYLTIMGSNFGNNGGQVLFDPNSAVADDEILGLFDFPAQCGDYWFDDHIIVRVPDTLIIEDSYFIRIVRQSDSATSNDFNGFTVTDTLVGPQICAIDPDNGPIGNRVNIFGENLGSDDGTVTFFDNINTSHTGWNANQVLGIEIPVGASTGPVIVTDSADNNSNGLPFNVGACTGDVQCGVGNECCPGEFGDYCDVEGSCGITLTSCSYSWEVFTEAEPFGLVYNYDCASGLQSPSPWPDQHLGIGADGFEVQQASLDAFIDSNISALFNRDVDDADFDLDTYPNNVRVWQCNTGGPVLIIGDCNTEIFDANLDGDGILDILNQNTNREGFVFDPATDLVANTWYQVRLGTFHTEIGVDSWNPDDEQPPLDWHFKTRDSGLLCEVTSVAVTPQSPSADMYPGREKNFNASPLADNCNICGGNYDWQWSIDHTPGPASDYASITGPPLNTSVNRGYTRLEGGPSATQLLSAGDTSITLEATTTSNGLEITGQSFPVILAPILRVESYVPNCDDSCGDALIWAHFNTELQPSGLSQIDLHHCTDATCANVDGLDLINSINISNPYRIEVDGLADLTEGETYMVTLDASIVNIYGYTLGTDFSWQFTVGTGNCVMNGADIYPDNYTAYSYNDINYRGYAIADGGSCGAQAITCEDCDWNWSTNPYPSTIASIGTGSDHVTAVLSGLNNNPPTTDIYLTIDGGGLGHNEVFYSTPLTVNVSGESTGITELAVNSYYPDCGACTNSLAGIRFNSDLEPATVIPANIRIHNNYTGGNVGIISMTIAGGDEVIIEHDPFILGDEYQIEVDEAVTNTDLDGITGGWTSQPIDIENAACLADAAEVRPVTEIAGASDSVNYFALPTYSSASCGATPVDCPTCSYTWTNNSLGTFGLLTDQDPVFTTYTAPPLVDGAGTPDNMILDVQRGAVTLPVTPGTLTIDLSLTVGPALTMSEYWPDCAASGNACTNSQIGARFNTPIDATTLAGNAYVRGPEGLISTGIFTLTNSDRTVTIDTTALQMGDTYRVTFGPDIANTSASILGVATNYSFTVGVAECLIDEVHVQPPTAEAGINQSIPYSVETEITTIAGCEPMPIDCDTCTYEWTEADPEDLGDFNNATYPNPVFTTHPTVFNGQTTQIELEVRDQGELFEDTGRLEIVIETSTLPEVTLIGYFPPVDAMAFYCYNILPMFEFDTSAASLDRGSVRDQIALYEACSSADGWCPVTGSAQFVEADGITEVYFQPDNLLSPSTRHSFLLDDITSVVSEDDVSVTVLPELDLLSGEEPGGSNSLSLQFNTSNEICSIHRVVIDYDEGARLFTCLDPRGCEGDADPVPLNGNQHEYRSLTYSIGGNLLGTSGMTYNWMSSNDAVVSLVNPVSDNIYGTAESNGNTNLSVEVYLNSEPRNVLTNAISLQVATCEEPWPSLDNYPWNDGEGWNFSTYYCIKYDESSVELPNIDIPTNVTSPDQNVLDEFITTIHYPTADSGQQHPYLGSLAYYDEADSKSNSLTTLEYLLDAKKASAQSGSIVDIIAFRVMENSGHLSVMDWYNKYAPNSNESGSLSQVDGYEALQVGSTVYVAAANAEGDMWTNIYIIAHNIGANSETLNIYNQMLANFKLNTNLAVSSENFCNSQMTRSCSSDFDCPAYCADASGNDELDCEAGGATWMPADTCNSPMLKLRRDTKRLSDLVNINNAILAYGEANKACERNSLISCEIDDDCPGESDCISYYPPLNAGSYINGLSNSSWPSWQGVFSNALAILAPSDPVGLFNGCPDGYSPETCWNEATLNFICPTNSLVYMYNIEGIGQTYYLGANFEYDGIVPSPGITFSGNLNPVVTMDLTQSQCADEPINAPGSTSSPYCGNGIIDVDYCTVPCEGCTVFECINEGGWYIQEECDSQFWNLACSEIPPGADIFYSIVGDHDWWNEQTVGCYSPGTIDSDNNLIECTWYESDPVLTAAQCGGYCGDGFLQSYYETCDGNVPAGEYTCVYGDPNDLSCDNCQIICNDDAGTYPAALCGDGLWSEGMEQCDPSASPNGNYGWDCTESGTINCSASCEHTCTVGEPYPGFCGNGVVNGECSVYCSECDSNEAILTNTIRCHTAGGVWSSIEDCDYANYEAPLPEDSHDGFSYGCTLSCEFDNTYCGDGVWQYDAQEMCDYGLDNNDVPVYTTPEPLFSDEYNQYLCRDIDTYTATNNSTHRACTATLGGYCGDGYIQDGTAGFGDYDEECDPGTPWDGIAPNPATPLPGASSIANQYSCDVDCVGTVGGYCGDGEAQIDYDELCDGQDYPARPLPSQSDFENTYTCADDCMSSVSGAEGGYCGDGVTNHQYYESCDWATLPPEDYPWPRGENITNFSTQINQYVCNDCINQGGYCGNGRIDGECNVNCSNLIDGVFTSPYNCTDSECSAEGGGFTPYEQCDSGFNPAYAIDKDIDIVYIFDMSATMSSVANELCGAVQDAIDDIDEDYEDINYRISIMVLGDNDGAIALTPNIADDLPELSPWLLDDDHGNVWLDEAQQVFTNLVTGCDLYTDPDYHDYVRYLSFYENDDTELAYNHINNGVNRNGEPTVYETCSDASDPAGRVENWGYATKRIIEDYEWLDGYQRLVIPISDEAAYCGSNGSTIEDIENCIDDGGNDILLDIIELANLENPAVHVSPVLFPYVHEDLAIHGQCLASGTGGVFMSTTDNWAVTTVQVVNATFCDGDGDGHMDCTLVP